MSKGKILVVEDELIVARDIQVTLESFGYEVPEIVSSGEEAVQAAYRLNPDLMMMDIMIKGSMDGVDAAEIIRSQFDIPVIYLTAYSDEETLRRAKLTESYGFIAKPFDEREIYVAVEFALYKHQLNHKMLETKDWLESTLRSIPVGLIACDRKGKIALLNHHAENLLGFKEHELKERALQEIIDLSVLTEDDPRETIVKFQSRHGVTVLLQCSQNPIRNEKGKNLGKIVVLKGKSE